MIRRYTSSIAFVLGLLLGAYGCGDDDAPPVGADGGPVTDSGPNPEQDSGPMLDSGPMPDSGPIPMLDGGPSETDGGECPMGMSGPECTDCAEGYQDADGDGECTLGCAATGADALDCGDFGECVDTSGTRECVCEAGTTGDTCDACDEGWEEVRGRCTPVLEVLGGLRHWFDADHTSLSTNATDGVTLWGDRRSGEPGTVVLNASATDRPVATEGWNGRRVVRFSGDSRASAFTGSDAVSTGSYTIWAVAKPAGALAGHSLVTFRTGDLLAVNLRTMTSGYRFIHRSPASAAGGDQLSVGRPATAPDLIRVRRRGSSANPAAHNLHIDVATDGVFGSRNASAMPLTQGAVVGSHIITLGALPGASFSGDIGEVLVFDRAVTDAESLEIVAYLRAKWGI